MTVTNFEALITHLLASKCSAAQIKEVWHAIIAQHRKFRLAAPTDDHAAYARYWKVVENQAAKGTQRLTKSPLYAKHLKDILCLRVGTFGSTRDQLAVALATVCALRPGEVTELQSCDVWYDFDCAVVSGALYKGTAAINVRFRKNDQAAKGHHPRVGKAADPRFDIVRKLKAYQREFRLENRAGCTKKDAPADRCKWCFPLFPRTKQRDLITVPTMCQLTTSWFSSATNQQCTAIGLDPKRFTGVSARKGGISTALDGGVNEAVIYLQSGHGSHSAGRDYMAVSNVALLYATWSSFRL
jgi:hypothetical protein